MPDAAADPRAASSVPGGGDPVSSVVAGGDPGSVSSVAGGGDPGPVSPVAAIVLAAGAGSRYGMPKALVRGADGRPWVHRVTGTLAAAGIGRVVVVLGAEADRAAALVPDGLEVVIADDWQTGMAASLRAGIDALVAGGRAGIDALVPGGRAGREAATAGGGADAGLGGARAGRVDAGSKGALAGGAGGTDAGSRRARAGGADAGSGGAETGAAGSGTEAVVIALVDQPDLPPVIVERLLADGLGPDVLRRMTYRGQPGHPVLIGRNHWAALRESLRGDSGAGPWLAAHGVVAIPGDAWWDGADIDTPQ